MCFDGFGGFRITRRRSLRQLDHHGLLRLGKRTALLGRQLRIGAQVLQPAQRIDVVSIGYPLGCLVGRLF
ncbi:MAG: hypothetical protein RIS76_4092 [Verrucomicrobiota bacterium]